MRSLDPTEANVYKLYQADPDIVNHKKKLTATYWHVFDRLDYKAHANQLEMLQAVTEEDRIQRARRRLHQEGIIVYSEAVDKITEVKYKEAVDKYGEKVMIQI